MSAFGRSQFQLKWSLRLVRTVSLLVPRADRVNWRREWQSELRSYGLGGQRRPAGLLRRSLGAIPHALWLRRRSWSLRPWIDDVSHEVWILRQHPGFAQLASTYVDTVLRDARFAFRGLRKAPGFTAIATVTLALGLGANVAMFSVINHVLFERLPFTDPNRVVLLLQRQSNGATNIFSVPGFLEWKRHVDVLPLMAAFQPAAFTLGVDDRPERILGARLAHEMFQVLGVAPAMGRAFTADEDRPGAGGYVVLSDTLWKTRLGANPRIVGSSLDIDGTPHTVLGVMPPGFFVSAITDRAWVPYQMPIQDALASSRAIHSVFVLARLERGENIKQTQQNLDSIAVQLHREDPQSDAGYGVIAQEYRDARTASVRPALSLLMGSVGFVLLIACANVSNLLLMRASRRRTELCVRTAIGASRGRLIRQLMTESLLLAIVGGLVGVLFAHAGITALIALHPTGVPDISSVSLEPVVLLFAGAMCVTVTVVFGIIPAFSASRVDVSALRDARPTSNPSTGTERRLLVIVETALAFILLTGAGLSLKSLWYVARVDPGFNPTRLITFAVPAPEFGLARQQPYAFYRQIVEKIHALPGVQDVTVSRDVPFSGTNPSMPVAVDGGAPQTAPGQVVTRLRVIGPGYFRVFQIPVLQGRDVLDEDAPTAQPVVIISKSLAQRYWPHVDPIGRQLRPNIADAPWYRVVGVVADVRHLGLDQGIEPTAYYPYTQMPKTITHLVESTMTIVVRGRGDIAGLSESFRQAVAAVDKTVPLYQMQTAENMIAAAGSLRRLDTWLIGTFAAIALALSMVGVYGVMAHAVVRRTREIGIRMAVGARRGDILRIVVLPGVSTAVIGISAGMAGALALTRVMTSLLVGVSPTDISTFALTALVLFVLPLAACVIPSLRATRIDPILALRCE